MDIFAAKTEDRLALQTFYLPEDFSVAAQFYIGLQHEKKLIAQEIRLINEREDVALHEYLFQCLEYLNNLQPLSAESSEEALVLSAFHLTPLNSRNGHFGRRSNIFYRRRR